MPPEKPPGLRPILALAALLGLGAVPLAALTTWIAMRAPSAAPPVYSTVPEFRLTAHTERPFGSAELRGHVWIANFIFTRCPTVCPALTARMAEVQARTEALPDLRLVSFSVDPAFDTPPVLAALARQVGAGPRWSFLTGSLDAIRAAVEAGLKISAGRGPGEEGPVIDPAQVLHGTHFVLVDGEGRIRGYHDVDDEQGFEELLAAAKALLAGS